MKPTLTPSPLRQICNFTATPPAPVPNKSQLSPDDTHGELRKSNGMGAFERRFIKYKYHADTVTDTIKARIRTFTTAPSPPPTCKSTYICLVLGDRGVLGVFGVSAGTAVSDRQFHAGYSGKYHDRNRCHALDNPASTSFQGSHVIEVCYWRFLLFFPMSPSASAIHNATVKSAQNTQHTTQNEPQFQMTRPQQTPDANCIHISMMAL